MGGQEPEFKGFSKYFNSYTYVGKRNTALATYGVVFSLVFYYWLFKKPSAQKAKAAHTSPTYGYQLPPPHQGLIPMPPSGSCPPGYQPDRRE
ncbi:unnamed protein product [Cyprideis torosa]|uniref:Uncharacterized protein n=1 Tax=Cyprideis torosa TaxID=163714 RepID=A0A7R8WHV2_9CRUS|nr:unnamed protein product [Cyprideis torosa]CAG0897049.1 unnamed protein product [Cyprideis torosa]